MAREITLKISLNGSEKVEAQIDNIGDGLHELKLKLKTMPNGVGLEVLRKTTNDVQMKSVGKGKRF